MLCRVSCTRQGLYIWLQKYFTWSEYLTMKCQSAQFLYSVHENYSVYNWVSINTACCFTGKNAQKKQFLEGKNKKKLSQLRLWRKSLRSRSLSQNVIFYKSSFSFLFTPWITVFRVFVYLIHLLIIRDVGWAVKKVFSSNAYYVFALQRTLNKDV